MRCAIVDNRISAACERGLILRGFCVVKLPASKRLSAPVGSHPDMLLFYHDGHIISSADYCDEAAYAFSDIRESAPNVSIHFSDSEFKEKYPYDAIFNALVIGDKIFLKSDTASSDVLKYAKSRGLSPVHVSQGYPACTTLAFGEAAITADKGMARVLRREGFRVTEIENGGISLPPYEYGFIGGASGVFGNTVYFLGDVKRHPDGEKIIRAIESEGFNTVSLSDEELADLGRIIFIA